MLSILRINCNGNKESILRISEKDYKDMLPLELTKLKNYHGCIFKWSNGLVVMFQKVNKKFLYSIWRNKESVFISPCVNKEDLISNLTLLMK